MKRRHFLIAATAVTAMTLAGCKSDAGDKYVGYWELIDKNFPHIIFQITRDGDTFLVEESYWRGGLQSGKYVSLRFAGKLQNGELKVNRTASVIWTYTYLKDSDHILKGDEEYKRTTAESYKEIRSRTAQ
ncbi:hypothetical protein H0A71_19845 [Alcaligenaceae bacterium]|nr:hypothetical protein [Alcaligenaceae bacterium]